MNRFIILFSIVLFFASFVKSIPSALQKRDPLSGFKQCVGKFPNTITGFDYSPNPINYSKPIKFHLAGKATVAIEKDALMTITGYVNNQIGFLFGVDYCKAFVKPSGFDCPVGKGDFSHSTSWSIPSNDEGPSNEIMEYGLQVTVSNPDGQVLSCITGTIKVFFP